MNTKFIMVSLLALGLSAIDGSAWAGTAVNLVTNGSFTTVTQGATQLIETNGYGANIANWTTTSGYSFLLTSANQATSGFNNGYQNNGSLYTGSGTPYQISLSGGSNPSLMASPDGGNFIAQDGGFMDGTLSQSISGLTVGDHYQLSFYQAAGQQTNYFGATTDQWQISLGGQGELSSLINDASGGFSGWQSQTLIFTATNTTEVLGFLAQGTPSGEPPMVMLDGVSLVDVPEPASLALLVVGLLGIIGARRWTQYRH